jgi:hypothetical protein
MAILPSPDKVRQARKQRNRAATRRNHYVGRIETATSRRQQLAEAFDYLRAALAGKPDNVHEQVIGDVLAMADKVGETK